MKTVTDIKNKNAWK